MLWRFQPNYAIFMFNALNAIMNVNIQKETYMKKIKVIAEMLCVLCTIWLAVVSWVHCAKGNIDEATFYALWIVVITLSLDFNKR